jgi:hypothetical protein
MILWIQGFQDSSDRKSERILRSLLHGAFNAENYKELCELETQRLSSGDPGYLNKESLSELQKTNT